MPEGQEVETDKLREEIHEELEKEGGSMLRGIALSTAIFAAIAAIASLKAGDTVNEALVLKTESTRLQAQASDQWAYYQAKGIKKGLQETAQTPWLEAQKTPPPQYAEQAKKYGDEQAEIEHAAREKEAERDARSREADDLLAHHHGFASAVALLQVGIALGAVAALTRNRLIWYGSLLLGATGVVLFSLPFIR